MGTALTSLETGVGRHSLGRERASWRISCAALHSALSLSRFRDCTIYGLRLRTAVPLICIGAPWKLHFGIRSLLPAKGKTPVRLVSIKKSGQLWSGVDRGGKGVPPLSSQVALGSRPEPEQAVGVTLGHGALSNSPGSQLLWGQDGFTQVNPS